MTSKDEIATSLAGAESYCPACSRSYAESVTVCPDDGTRLVRFREQVDPLVGRVLDGRFEVRSRLGRGGMGTVYRAWQRSVDREIAIKVIDPRLAHDRTVAKRFLREARLASRLAAPTIVHVIDFGQTDDEILYLAMELLRGHTLGQRLAAGEAFGLRRVIAIGVQLCDALEIAHREGIVHRDLKPQNVVLVDDPSGRDQVKVLDFGLAKSLIGEGTTITKDDALMGTPLYMAPEVIGGRPAEPASDLYSLGCMLHEMLAGTSPFRDATANAVFARHLTEPPPPLPATVPAQLRGLVEQLLAKQPEERPASATIVRDRLLAAGEIGADVATATVMSDARLGLMLAETQSSDLATAPTPPPSRRPLRVALVAGLAIGGAAIAVWATRDHDPEATAPAAAPVPAPAPAAEPDAAPAADAATTPIDAGRKRTRRPSRDRTKLRPERESTPPGDEPDVDFIPVTPR